MKHFPAIAIHTGVILTLEGDLSMTALQGSAIARGAVEHLQAPVQAVHDQLTVFAGWNFLLGLVLIVVGLGYHAWSKTRDERPVKVRVRKTAPKKHAWFWVSFSV